MKCGFCVSHIYAIAITTDVLQFCMKKMKKLFTATFLFLLVCSCKKEILQNKSQSFNLTNFNKLNIGSNFEVSVIQESSFSIKAEGNPRDLDNMKAEVLNGELKINFLQSIENRGIIKLKISMPSLARFSFDGNSNAILGHFNESTDIQGVVSNGSKVLLIANASNFKFDVLKKSELTVFGSSEWLMANVSSNSLLNSFEAAVNNIKCLASDTSIIKVFAKQHINASANSNSFIYVKGNPGSKFLSESNDSKIIEE